jgi:putative FmdB family regulatory protein
MPIYEYRCRACAHPFEALVRAGDTPACPSCAAVDLERLVSLFAVDSDGTRQAARETSMPKGVKRQQDKEVADVELYNRHHH